MHVELESSDYITCMSASNKTSQYGFKDSHFPKPQTEKDLKKCHLDHFHYYLEEICLKLIYKADLSFLAFYTNFVSYRTIVFEITKPPSSVA